MIESCRVAAAAGLECWPAARVVRLKSPSGATLTMVWDGAAYDRCFSRPILLEMEARAIEAPHIEWHLGRLLLMQLHGAPLGGVIWITRESLVGALVRVIERWSAIQLASPMAPGPPPMQV